MKTLSLFFLGSILLVSACQKPTPVEQPTEPEKSSTDVIIGQQMIEHYLAGDWDSFSKSYAKSARIWRNENWTKNEGFSVDQYVDNLQQGLQSISSYTFDYKNWETIVNEEGQHWVLFWGVWKGHSEATDKDYEIAIHIAMLVDDGKVQLQGDFFNNSELTLDIMQLEQEAG